MFKILVCEESLQHSIDMLFPTFDVDIATNIDELFNLTFEKSYDLYIVNFYYYASLNELKKSGDKTITIFIDEYYEIFHIKKVFLIGDDYMIKPLVMQELKIRVDYHYRKLFNHSKNIIVYKNFYFHVNSKQLFLGTQKIKLSPNEMKLLELFLTHINKPISKDIIYDILQSNSDGSLRVYISKLNKLDFDISYDRSIVSYTLDYLSDFQNFH